MGEMGETVARYREARVKPRRHASEAEFRRACRAQKWPEEQIERCLSRARPDAWFEVGKELLRIKPERAAS
jgi:hypothetical protein